MKKIKVLHLIYRFDIGGLEKVLAESINNLNEGFEHTVVSLTEIAQYASENLNYQIPLIALNKKPGNDFSIYGRLYKLLKEIKPDVLHTYNLPTLEYQLIAFFAGVKIRIHAEHGRDISDPEGKNKKYNILRRVINPFVKHWVTVSNDLYLWLQTTVKIADHKNKLIYNGVDTEIFKPSNKVHNGFIIGTIGRFDPIKNQKILIDTFLHIKNTEPELISHLKICIIGKGDEFENIQQLIKQNDLENYFDLPGVKYDINEQLNNFDIFVLPSIAEGVPMTLLEAMSVGLPSICSNVGGIPEVLPHNSGYLVAPENVQELSEKLIELMKDANKRKEMGQNARKQVIENFSIQAMVNQYKKLYSKL
ncbi:MAG: glycosyltransferase [Gammaproteobacteria bacterium]|nr:glycosyltransferase [Gammaproteobacteria bacterium]